MISIAVASNNNYAILMAVLIKSIVFNHHTDEDITFYVLNDKISSSNQDKINSLIKNSPEITIKWINADSVFPKNVKFPMDNSAFPFTAYLRLFAPFVVEESVKKLIYFDVDMVVRKDVSELWNMNMQGYTMAAVLDVGKTAGTPWGGIPNYKQLGIDANAKYFNSGMMIIDCEKWRNENIPEMVFKAMRDNIEHVNFADQYGLNVVFTGKWLAIDPLWNWFANIYHPNPKCIHYLDIKPIFKSYNSDIVLQKEFFKYLEMTPWKGISLKSDFSRLLGKAIIKFKKKFISLVS
ncbi:glycosyltransferase family 8 protein [Pedobacter alpinus]|uniref:Glycosyltransferase family 8 protein n=1 Tax=Pedobacter alpinus TaxID=1590643 RepID=A0ABW5TWS1_9SPHI